MLNAKRATGSSQSWLVRLIIITLVSVSSFIVLANQSINKNRSDKSVTDFSAELLTDKLLTENKPALEKQDSQALAEEIISDPSWMANIEQQLQQKEYFISKNNQGLQAPKLLP